MFNPNKRIGDDEEDGPSNSGGPKPKVMLAIKFNPSKRIGEDDQEDGQDDGMDSDPDELMNQACEGICRVLNVNQRAAMRLKPYLEAFITAAQSKGEDECGQAPEDEEN